MQTQGGGTGSLGPAGGRPVSLPGDRLVTTRVAAERTGGAYSLFEIEVAPGGGEGPHVQHREDECLCVLEGSFEVYVEGSKIRADRGSVIYVPKGSMHAHENVGAAGGRLLVVHTPGGPAERFYEEAGKAPKRNEFPTLAAEHGIEICETTGNTGRCS